MAGTILNTRVDPEVLSDAERILKTLGISRSVAINMFYRMVILKKGLPWKPNLDEIQTLLSKSNKAWMSLKTEIFFLRRRG